MGKLFYLDSNVLISVLREEMDKQFRFLAVEAQVFFDFVRKNNIILVLSELFYQEVSKKIKSNEKDVQEYFKSININFKNAKVTEEDWQDAKKLEAQGVHCPDSVHAAIALREKCDCIVTFNVKDFEKIRRRIKAAEPKEVI